MKIKIIVIAFFVIILLPVNLLAQNLDGRAPGIYAIVGEDSIPLIRTRGTIIGVGGYVGGAVAYYKGDTSGIYAVKTFVLVTDLKKSLFTDKFPFVKKLTPANMHLLPLVSNPKNHRREYCIGLTFLDGMVYQDDYGLEFQWERITDNSFLITLPDNLPAGEYGFSFSYYRVNVYDFFYSVFGFTIPENK